MGEHNSDGERQAALEQRRKTIEGTLNGIRADLESHGLNDWPIGSTLDAIMKSPDSIFVLKWDTLRITITPEGNGYRVEDEEVADQETPNGPVLAQIDQE